MKTIKNHKSEIINYLVVAIMLLTATCKENYVRVTGVRLDNNNIELTVGETLTLKASIQPANATEKKVYWRSENPEYVTIDKEGKITGVAVTPNNMNAYVWVSAKDGEYTDCIMVKTVGTLSTLTTTTASAITATTATLGGNITNAGIPAFTERGVVYSTSQNPTTANNKTVITGTGTGSFSTTVSGLTANTTYYVRAYTINSAGTAYGNEISFTTSTSGTLPTLTTNSVTTFTATTATLSGNITNAGTPAYTERGVVYSTTQTPTTANNKTIITGTGAGNFSTTVSDLTANTTYYVRVYAINSVGTAYGNEISFTTTAASGTLPTLTTNSVTTFTATTATLGGNITNEGTPAYTERGVVYSTTQNPTTANNKTVISGTSTGSFSTNVSDLTANTTYYVRVYAINSVGTAYGNEINFITSAAPGTLPTLTTNSVTTFTATTATLGGNITNAGTPAYTERGVVYSTTQNPTTANNKTVITGTGTGNFSTTVSGLTANTTYYVRAYAINSAGTAYGAQVNFTTSGILPTLTTTAASAITATGTTLGGNITNAGTPAYTERGVVYSTSQNPTTSNNKTIITGTGTGSFSTTVSGLTANTTYYVRAYAINSAGTAYGAQVNFTTLTGVWTQKANFAGNAYDIAVGFSIGNKGYVGTGHGRFGDSDEFWEYDPEANSWTQKANVPGGFRFYAVGFSIGNKGYIGTGSNGATLNDFWEYDPVSNSWTQKADFAGGSRYNAVGFSIDNKGYIGIGSGNVNNLNDFWEYDPVSNIWTQKADFAGGGTRTGAVGFSIGSKGYIGTGSGGGYHQDFWEYDPVSNSWTQKADFAGEARSSAVGFSIGDKGYIGTGYIGGTNGFLNDFWEYDPTSNGWTQKVNFAGVNRYNAVGFSIGNKGYVGTGSSVISRQDFWEFTP